MRRRPRAGEDTAGKGCGRQRKQEEPQDRGLALLGKEQAFGGGRGWGRYPGMRPLCAR